MARRVCAVIKLPFPSMVIQLCSHHLQQSTSDVCQQPERVPRDAFPFPKHKHTGNVESFGSVYAVKSQFVQKWVQVSSHTFARISNDLAPLDDRGISAEDCLIQNREVILVGVKYTFWTISLEAFNENGRK